MTRLIAVLLCATGAAGFTAPLLQPRSQLALSRVTADPVLFFGNKDANTDAARKNRMANSKANTAKKAAAAKKLAATQSAAAKKAAAAKAAKTKLAAKKAAERAAA